MRCLRSCSFVILLLLLLSIEATAISTGFSTEDLPLQDKNTFLANFNISLIEDEPTKRAIKCFDVNKNGLIAIGQKSLDNNILCVYSYDGIFQYGYQFNCSGNIGIEWDDDDINIYFARSDVIAKVNSMAKVVEISKVENTIDNNSYLNHFIYSTKRASGDIVYTLRNDMGLFNLFSSNYSQLIATNSMGEETVLYDVNSFQFAKMVLGFLGVLFFLFFSLLIILRQAIKQS